MFIPCLIIIMSITTTIVVLEVLVLVVLGVNSQTSFKTSTLGCHLSLGRLPLGFLF